MPSDVVSRVIENRALEAGYFLTTFESPAIASTSRPGQFVMAGSIDPAELLLRRPFSVCLRGRGSAGRYETISLLYRTIGRGTEFLSRLAPRAEAALLGPLGNGFCAPGAGETPVLVAGGIGIAAFPFLVEELAAAGRPPVLLYGGRTASDLPMLDWLRERTSHLEVTTDDGSAGERAFVTVPLARRLAGGGRGQHLYVCGPTPMMKAAAGIAASAGAACQVALETRMACGYGVCVGCVAEVVGRDDDAYGRYRRVCVDGPVFDAREIRW